MPMLTELADVLRAAGCTVVEVDGWKTRGHQAYGLTSPEKITGGVAHHTAGPAWRQGIADYPSLPVVRDGRPGLPGPLAQLGVGFSGTWYVIAAGLCYHAGVVNDPAYANQRSVGVEADNPGDGSPWPAKQLSEYARGCAALAVHYGITWRGHKEICAPAGRKSDPDFDMGTFRNRIEAWKVTQTAPKTTTTPVPFVPLKRGDAGPRVLKFQTFARAHLHSVVALDSQFGAYTQGVVIGYQRLRHLYADGIIGPATAAALKKDGCTL